jgi:hypothetical protein
MRALFSSIDEFASASETRGMKLKRGVFLVTNSSEPA